ncbi:MAG: MarR family transcriptional regulator [Gammaproteobacteria bacterium]|nr:MarR family transcriptional regulator [Gammaproteobacteria bacterium]
MARWKAFRDDIWLEPDESPGFVVRKTNIAVGNALRRRLSKYGLTLGQYYIMRALWINEGQSQRALSEAVGTTEPTTASVLRMLEKNGLIRRTRNQQDRRTINIFLTENGLEMKRELLLMAMGVNEIATRGLSQHDIEEIKRLMRAMSANLLKDSENKPD